MVTGSAQAIIQKPTVTATAAELSVGSMTIEGPKTWNRKIPSPEAHTTLQTMMIYRKGFGKST
jgi:hypothetical protein